MPSIPSRPRIGLALGSGSARGWGHIGVIHALEAAGIVPDLVCGTSVGALIGAAYVDGDLDRLEEWARGLNPQKVVGYLDLSLNGGLIKGERLIEFFRAHFVDLAIAELSRPFAAVATDLYTGKEVWLREGSVAAAVHASIALPGLFTPVRRDGEWLVDGGLVNPVPVSLCRAMGAELVIAVDLNSDLVGRHLPARAPATDAAVQRATPANGVMARLQAGMAQLGLNAHNDGKKPPAVLDVLATSINIMQVAITRSRLADEAPDVLITPRLAHLGLMEFHRTATAIEAGRAAAEQVMPQLQAKLGEGKDAS